MKQHNVSFGIPPPQNVSGGEKKKKKRNVLVSERCGLFWRLELSTMVV